MPGNSITVVVPCYNQTQYLEAALESVFQQSFRPTEIIVVDDGSTEPLTRLTGEYPNVRFVRQNNQGPASARNSGFEISTGEYLVFLDADDRLLPHALETGFKALQDHPECAFASGQVRLISSDGSILETPEESCVQKNHYEALLRSNYIWTPAAVMFRRSALLAAGVFNRSLYGTEDWELYLRIARKFPVFCHQQIIAEHRMHPQKLTRDAGSMLAQSILALKMQRPHLNDGKLEEAYKHGIREVQRYWGIPLVEQIQKNRLDRKWFSVMRDLVITFKYYPAGLKDCFADPEPGNHKAPKE